MRFFNDLIDRNRRESVRVVQLMPRRPRTVVAVDDGHGGGGRTAVTSGTDSLFVEVERAISQVLRDPSSKTNTLELERAFPTGDRLAIDGVRNLTGPRLPAAQAVLTRQVNAFVEDVLPVLRSIRPRSAAVNGGEVEVLRTAIERDVRRISAEVARRDGPRTKLVDTLLEGLAGTFDEFHEAVLFDPSPNLESVGDEVQEADLDYVEASISSIQDLWDDFDPDGGLAGRLSKGALYLDVIAQTVRQLREAAVRVGFSDGEQRVTPFLPDDPDSLTVADLLDWSDRMAGPEGARMIAELGEPGLQSVGREADALFDLLEERFEQVGSRSSRDPLCVGEVDDELRTLHAQLQLLLTQA